MQYFPSPDNYRRNVTEAMAWAREHVEALRVVYEAFVAAGDWPIRDQLQRDLDRAGRDHVNLTRDLENMPPSIGIVEHNGQVLLNARGLSVLSDARNLLDAYKRVLDVGVERYLSEEEHPKVTHEDVGKIAGSEADALLVSRVIFREAWPFGSGSGFAEGPWEREVTRDFRQLRGVESIDDLLELQAQLRYGAPDEPERGQPRAVEPDEPPPTDPLDEAESTAGTVAEPPAVAGDPGPLYSERAAKKRRALSSEAFAQLVFGVLAGFHDKGYDREAFVGGDVHEREGPEPPRIDDPAHWLTLKLRLHDLWGFLQNPRNTLLNRWHTGPPWSDRELLLDVIELWHREVVSAPMHDEDGHFEGFYSRRSGQLDFRKAIEPVLAELDPPLTIRSDGQIVEADAAGLGVLGDRPLPEGDVADDVRAKVEDAVRLFRERDATRQMQLTALTQLAGVLERLRDDERLTKAMSRKDQGPLFHIANDYGIRHDNEQQRRDYGPAFREWIFHSYLAAIRLTMRVVDGDDDSE